MSSIPLAGPVLSLEDVRRSFQGRPVLRGFTAELEPGKVVGLLGTNGEGKTTLFQIILDMIQADSGRVEVMGLRPDGSGEIRQQVGYVPERPVFHEFMRVGEVLEWRSRFFRRWDEGLARSLARRLRLDLATPVRGASKGTLAKIAWVCAVAHMPALFLLDEPTSGLDALVRDDILDHLIGGLTGAGKALLVANHHMEELSGALDELWVLSDGTLEAVYDVESLRAHGCRLTARLKDGDREPAVSSLLPLGRSGPVRQWAAFDRGAVEQLAATGLVEALEREPLPMESILKLLLKGRAEAA